MYRRYEMTKGAFLVTDNRVLNLPLGRSLCSFARTAHSAHSLRSAPLCYARSVHGLTHFAPSLVGQLKFLNVCSRCKRVQWEQTRFSSSPETHPEPLKVKTREVQNNCPVDPPANTQPMDRQTHGRKEVISLRVLLRTCEN